MQCSVVYCTINHATSRTMHACSVFDCCSDVTLCLGVGIDDMERLNMLVHVLYMPRFPPLGEMYLEMLNAQCSMLLSPSLPLFLFSLFPLLPFFPLPFPLLFRHTSLFFLFSFRPAQGKFPIGHCCRAGSQQEHGDRAQLEF